jgi:hypothetical protein
MVRRVVAVGVAALLLAQLTATAVADDRSLREAGRSRDAEFGRLGRETRAAMDRWWDSGRQRRQARRVIRLIRRTRSEVDIVVAAVTREQPSSPDGETYKSKLLEALDIFDRALVWQIRGVRAGTSDRIVRARRIFRRADRLYARTRRLEDEAVKAIERVVPD